MRLIDADRTKESIPETSVDIFENCARCGLLDREQVFDLIDEQPTIEPKRGKWIRHVLKNANVPWGYDCSACGTWFIVGEDTIEKYDYCPNCGTRMEGAKNEEQL